MATYYVVSSPDPNPGIPHNPNWPRVLKLSFEAEEVHLLQGKGHGLGGAFYSFNEFCVSKWEDFFEGWDSDWLVEALSEHESLTLLDEEEFVRTLNRHASVETRES
ncbi:hypothetical protein ACFQJ7_13610 [Halovenus rubra]|uniref:Uncharacterized protein n=2 Tax=Halovenus rubra TaxID=869890 RepID=A0ACC7DZW6_9EURY|nr:hypothetical protein [Halovenus rubra]